MGGSYGGMMGGGGMMPGTQMAQPVGPMYGMPPQPVPQAQSMCYGGTQMAQPVGPAYGMAQQPYSTTTVTTTTTAQVPVAQPAGNTWAISMGAR